MKTRRTRGVGLLEVVLVVSISAVVVVAAAAHFRTLRQASDVADSRRAAFENARVALQRLSRHIRCAKDIAAISTPTDSAGSISITDSDLTDHVFARVGTELRYGIDTPTDLLADHIVSLCFEGFNALGPVDPLEPWRIDTVQVSLTASIPGSANTIDLIANVGLRRKGVGATAARNTVSCASQYTPLKDGILSYWNCYGPPDGLVGTSTANNKIGGRLLGFAPSGYTGQVHRLFVGLFVRIADGPMYLRVYHMSQEIYSHTFTETEISFLGSDMKWWWTDITTCGPGAWTHEDIDDLEVEIQGNGVVALDAVVVRAFLDPPTITFFWADRQGDGVNCPNQWIDPDNALGEGNDTYATADWLMKQTQSYRATVPEVDGEILGVQICLEAYINAPTGYSDDWLEAQAALPEELYSHVVTHESRDGLAAFAPGPANEGLVLLDITNDRPWSAERLNDRQIRIKTLVQGGNDGVDLKADAVGYRVLHAQQTLRGIVTWSE